MWSFIFHKSLTKSSNWAKETLWLNTLLFESHVKHMIASRALTWIRVGFFLSIFRLFWGLFFLSKTVISSHWKFSWKVFIVHCYISELFKSLLTNDRWIWLDNVNLSSVSSMDHLELKDFHIPALAQSTGQTQVFGSFNS